MAPTLAHSTAQSESVIRVAFSEIVSFIFILAFLIVSLLTSSDAFSLIQNPIFVILLFMGLNSPLQILLHWVLYPFLNKHEVESNRVGGKKRYDFDQVFGLIWKSITAFVIGWLGMHVIAVLFGAHFIKDAMGTTSWAAMVSSMVVTPGLCILGPKPRKWISLFNLKNFDTTPKRTFYFTLITTAVGCWMSPVVVPLDWDRPWQLWPVPGVVGAMAGFCLGQLIGGLKILKEMKFSKIH